LELWTGIESRETGSRSRARSKEQWGNLTDDDLTAIAGKRDQLEGKIQERYGIARDQARTQIDDWARRQNWS
jgi:uncharacterized protein YjbJ (UPF0337 family)